MSWYEVKAVAIQIIAVEADSVEEAYEVARDEFDPFEPEEMEAIEVIGEVEIDRLKRHADSVSPKEDKQ